MTNLFMNDLNTWCMNHMNMLGALDSTNGMIIHSYNPWWVLNVVFHSSPRLLMIWWYSLLRLILENILDLANWSNMSSRHGIRYLYFIVFWLMARLSTHIRHDSFFFGTKRVDITQGLILFWIYVFLATPPHVSATLRLL